MHEMGALITMAEQVHRIARQNNASSVSVVTVELGQISGLLPVYLNKYYAIIKENDPLLCNSELVIHETPAEGICKHCGSLYNIIKCHGICPSCQSRQRNVLRGREFILKSIAIPEQDSVCSS